MKNQNGRLPGVMTGIVTIAAIVACGGAATLAQESPDRFGFGQPATEAEIEAWNIDIMPDGAGLPPGNGTVANGASLYATKCAVCHGATGVEGPNDRLVAYPDEGFPAGDDPDSWSSRTIGNYWPYAPTLFDYIRRAMPQNIPGSLSDDEVYSLTAYLLFLNRIIPEDAEMNADALSDVRMPAHGNFHPDDRLDHLEVH